jgi:hypothetical protein
MSACAQGFPLIRRDAPISSTLNIQWHNTMDAQYTISPNLICAADRASAMETQMYPVAWMGLCRFLAFVDTTFHQRIRRCRLSAA